MPGTVTVERRGRVLLVTAENPPVNALSHAVREGLVDAIESAQDDDGIDAVIIRCAGNGFFAGADIREFGKPVQAPHLGEVVARIASASKPVISAIHGRALGGGFEVAMASHYRIASPDSIFGLPEVGLGIIPGSGGTQRLPRLVGLKPALQMIVDGQQWPAAQALELGAIDAIAEGNLTDAAIRFAEQHAGMAKPANRENVPADPELMAEWRKRAMTRKPGQTAPLKAVEAIGWSTEVDFDEAITRERALCLELLGGSQSRALRHIFAAERAMARSPRLDADAQGVAVGSVGVVGPGTMGSGIAATFASRGIPVFLLGRDRSKLEKAHERIAKMYDSTVKRGRMTPDQATAALQSVKLTEDYGDFADVDLVIEAVSENIDVKRDVFARLDAVCKPGAVLASNTSFLDIDTIAAATGRPGDVVGMHFFNPANIMRLLENVAATKSSQRALATAMETGRRIGKLPVLVGACDGFVGNRMLAQRSREALFLLEEGATPWQVDKAFRDFGLPMGPYELADLAGLDVVLATRKARFDSLPPREQGCEILPNLVAAGRLGRKSGAGYYKYVDGKPEPDPTTVELIAKHSREAGIEQHEFTDREIVERCLFAMINEGARLLDEGVVDRPHEIDIVWTQGFGFPAYYGGPMFLADETGLASVRDRLRFYARERNLPSLEPAPLLDRLADSGEGFYSAHPINGKK